MSTAPPCPAPATTAPLTAADRCDRCSAAAWVRVHLAAGDLLFCGHHHRAHREGLARAGAVVTASVR
ncbi:DUF7455 domain-containing protein [Pseudonocardia broussonetiae]|uniref:DUF7455 domain-containing protein n=1 Tax=Pseudonocardia broussonetiae TaxID=2736640 RepID=A0A6M6JNS2_9PSEU|nr:hypothetical protein [Pseudonocardia broussonetiae]QJY48242.1 hypothetical protein HOP40_22595 [Pseudonocardia broussonetiae]